MAETTRSDSETARTIFYAIAVLMAIYGLALLVFPHAMFALVTIRVCRPILAGCAGPADFSWARR